MENIMFFYKFIILIPLFVISCSSTEKIKGATKAETAYLRGMSYFENERYEEALEKFNIVKNKYPYSYYATPAKLKIADAYFEQGDYYDSSSLYFKFAELHPAYKDRDYAYFRSGVSLYKLVPSSIDRDLSKAKKAIELFKQFMKQFPNSKYFDDCFAKYNELKLKQAKKIMYIAEYYKKRDDYQSSLNRYLSVYNDYKNLGLDEEVIYNIYFLNKKLKNNEEANKFKLIYQENFPKGKML